MSPAKGCLGQRCPNLGLKGQLLVFQQPCHPWSGGGVPIPATVGRSGSKEVRNCSALLPDVCVAPKARCTSQIMSHQLNIETGRLCHANHVWCECSIRHICDSLSSYWSGPYTVRIQSTKQKWTKLFNKTKKIITFLKQMILVHVFYHSFDLVPFVWLALGKLLSYFFLRIKTQTGSICVLSMFPSMSFQQKPINTLYLRVVLLAWHHLG